MLYKCVNSGKSVRKAVGKLHWIQFSSSESISKVQFVYVTLCLTFIITGIGYSVATSLPRGTLFYLLVTDFHALVI